MSSHGALGIILDGKTRIIYSSQSSNPSNLGEKLVKFIRKLDSDPEMLETFKRNYRAIEWVRLLRRPTESDLARLATTENLIMECESDFNTLPHRNTWDWLLYPYMNWLPNWLQNVMNGIPFAADSPGELDGFYCEYGYIVDFDNQTIEFWSLFGQPEKDFYKCHPVGKLSWDDLKNWKRKIFTGVSGEHEENWIDEEEGEMNVAQ